jgi:hypothetical protein
LQLGEINEVLQEKQDALKQKTEQIEAYRKAAREAESTCLQHGVTISRKRKDLSSLCAKARNNYSKKEIRRDFKAGLRVWCIGQGWAMGRVYRSRLGYV